MVGSLLLRGMLAGLIAGLICFAFLTIVGEPQVDRAIAFESAMDAAQPGHADEPEVESVSRQTQAGLGLLTGVAVYSAAFGGLFALAYAFAHGRVGPADPRSLSALLALAAFVAVYLVPNLKYPSNPPAVGQPDTIGARTALYFAMMAISIAGAIAATIVRRRLAPRLDSWNASLAAAAIYAAIVGVASFVLPAVDEVPATFPASLLWKFRIASLGGQAVIWTAIGLLFGALTRRADQNPSGLRLGAARR
jgi:predicted cobalt transporter CbtA